MRRHGQMRGGVINPTHANESTHPFISQQIIIIRRIENYPNTTLDIHCNRRENSPRQRRMAETKDITQPRPHHTRYP